LSCFEACVAAETEDQNINLQVSGGAEKAGHSRRSAHYDGTACDVSNARKPSNRGLNDKNAAACATACGFQAGQYEIFPGNPDNNHWHLQLEPGNGVPPLGVGSMPIKIITPK
jgi:hypothetical protein